MAKQSSGIDESKINLQDTLSQLLVYLKDWRLVFLLLCFALSIGLSYYVYGRSVYYAKALIDYKQLGIPIHSETTLENRRPSSSLRERQLLGQLNSNYLVSRTAARLGLTSDTSDFREVRERLISKHFVSLADPHTLVLEVWPYDAKLAREWPKAVVDEFLDYQAKLRKEYREVTMERYGDDLVELKKKLSENLDLKIDYEKENAFLETFIEQNQLTEVPRELVVVRHRLDMIEGLKPQIDSETLSIVEKLSLLGSFENEDPIQVSNMVRSKEGAAPMMADRQPSQLENQVFVVPSDASGLAKWEELEKDMRRLEEEIAKASVKYLPEHRVMTALKTELEQVSDGLEREFRLAQQRFDFEYMRLKDRLVALEDKLPEYREVSRKYDAFRQEYSFLEKGEETWDKAHEELMKKASEIEFGGEKARFELRYLGLLKLREDPVSPSKAKLIYISLALGLVLVVGVPFAIEFFNDSSNRFQDVERRVGLTGIGLVPLCDKADLENVVRSPVLDSHVPNFLLESFRIVRANISLNKLRDGSAHVIMVSSARPSEGKTTQAANLAWAFSSVGDRTILLDTDLRRGRIHKILGIENRVGLTNVLTEATPWEDAVQTTSVANLDVLPRGPIVAGSTEVLCKKLFEEIVDQLKDRYDRIILDTPPVLGLSETTSLQRVTDGVVLVIRAERTPKRDVSSAVELLAKAGAHFFGFVLNAVDLSKPSNYYNYYYYSAAYYDEFADDDNEGSEGAEKLVLVGKS